MESNDEGTEEGTSHMFGEKYEIEYVAMDEENVMSVGRHAVEFKHIFERFKTRCINCWHMTHP